MKNEGFDEFEITGVFDRDLPEPLFTLPDEVPQAIETGRVRNLLALEEEDFKVKAIARRLAHVNRYAGALPWPYAVTTHSLLVAKLLENAYVDMGYETRLVGRSLALGVPSFAYAGLMHDVTEAFGIGDMIAPIKRLRGMATYNELEYRLREQLSVPFELSLEESVEVRRADERAYQLECRYMKGSWPRPEHTRFEPWYPTDSEHEACLFYLRQEFNWRDSARLFVEAFTRLAPETVKARCL